MYIYIYYTVIVIATSVLGDGPAMSLLVCAKRTIVLGMCKKCKKYKNCNCIRYVLYY